MNSLNKVKEAAIILAKRIKCKIAEKYAALINWYKEYENKRALSVAVIGWVCTLVIIIMGCRINKLSRLSASANETAKVEVESTFETSKEELKLMREAATTTAGNVNSNTTSESQTVKEETTADVLERATVDVSKLDVSMSPIVDDAPFIGDGFASISSADIKTVSSTNFSNEQFSYGIDISYHQGKIDWAKVKAAGVEYAFIRVGNRGYETGKLCKDSRFDENVQGAIANGIKVGVYFFSQAVTEQEALEEASLTLNYIRKYNITLPVVIDWETDKGYRTYSGLSRAGLTNIISTFCDTVERYGYDSMVYMCKDDYVNRINTSLITSKYKSWVAWYFKEYSTSDYLANVFRYGDLLPDMTFDYYMWQYSSKGRIDGIKELVDMNVMILPKKIYDIKLNISNTVFTVNKGSSADLMNGVSASDSEGMDAASRVNISIVDSKGTVISKEKAFANSGIYKVNYIFTDNNGTNISKQAVLYVRNAPEIYYDGVVINNNSTKQIYYEYDNSISANDNYAKICEFVKSKISACYYDTVAGNSTKRQITDGTFTGFETILTDGEIDSKTVEICYSVSDGRGMSSQKKFSLIINRVTEQETESVEESSGENIS